MLLCLDSTPSGFTARDCDVTSVRESMTLRTVFFSASSSGSKKKKRNLRLSCVCLIQNGTAHVLCDNTLLSKCHQ